MMGILEKLFARRRGSRPKGRRLRLEPLEPRCLLSGAVPDILPADFAEQGDLLASEAMRATVANPPAVSIQATDAAAAEQDGEAGVFTVTRSIVTDAPLVVHYHLRGAAENGEDYARLSHTAIIPANEASVTITVTPWDDRGCDPGENIVAVLSRRGTYAVDAAQKSATVVIADNEPILSVQATDATAAEQASETGVFTVTRSVVTNAPLVVHYEITGAAENGHDYARIRHVVIIAADAATATVTVTPRDDKARDPGETVVVTLDPRRVYGVNATGSVATVTITDNEVVVSIQATDGAAAEQGSETGVFTITRSVVTNAPLVIHYYVLGAAENGDDYAHIRQSVVIPANAATATITVTPKDDTKRDPGETVIIELFPRHAYGVDPTSGSDTVTITDNEVVVSIQATDATAGEQDSGTGVFTVTRTVVTNAPLVVYYQVAGTAQSGKDYAPLGHEVTIPADTATATITVTPVDDTRLDPGETVFVELLRRHAYGVDPNSNDATVAITDNEPFLSIQTTSFFASEGGGAGTFTVTRNVVTSTPLDVFYRLTGTAENGRDYAALSGVVTIAADAATATITVTPTDDTIAEPMETVVAELRPVSGWGIDPARSSATLWITDDDPLLAG